VPAAAALELSQDGFGQFGLEFPVAVAAEDAAPREPMSVDRASFLLLVGATVAGHLLEVRGVQFGGEIDQLGRGYEEQVVVSGEVAAGPAGRTPPGQFTVLLELHVDPVVENCYFCDDSAISF
jgi:hypothetical protein